MLGIIVHGNKTKNMKTVYSGAMKIIIEKKVGQMR